MIFNWEVSFGDIIAFCAFIGTIVMFILSTRKQRKTEEFAQNANAYNDSAKKYYDLMVEQLKAEKQKSLIGNAKTITVKAYCDANIVRIGSNKWILKVFNKGNANAIDVSFKYLVNDAPDILRVRDEMFPIKLLEPQKSVDYHLGIYLGLNSSSWEYEITWTNEDGTKDGKKGILTLPLS